MLLINLQLQWKKKNVFDHPSIKFRIKGWYSCQGAGRNARSSEMFEITGFEISSIDYKSVLKSQKYSPSGPFVMKRIQT